MRKQLLIEKIYKELYEQFKSCFVEYEHLNNLKASEVYELMQSALQDAYKYYTYYTYYREEIKDA